MPSDAEVMEVLVRNECGDGCFYPACGDAGCRQRYAQALRALSALRSAGYAVVKAGELAEIMRLAATSIIDTRPLTDAEIERTRQLVAEHGAHFIKDPTNA